MFKDLRRMLVTTAKPNNTTIHRLPEKFDMNGRDKWKKNSDYVPTNTRTETVREAEPDYSQKRAGFSCALNLKNLGDSIALE